MRFVKLMFVFILFTCSEEKHTPPLDTPKTKVVIESSQNHMVDRLNLLYDTLDFKKIQYFRNADRAAYYMDLYSSTQDNNQKNNLFFRSNIEYLFAGKNASAINGFEKLIKYMESNNFQVEANISAYEFLALAYLREGEVENCINNFNKDACIVPLNKGGTFAFKQGPKQAINIYKKILAIKPERADIKWMLNFSFMTLGKYPDGVPKMYLIDPKHFKSDFQLQKFQNVSNKFGLNTLGLSGGVCFDDFDNDGLLDVICSSWGIKDQIRLFKNMGNGKFEDSTNQSGLLGITGGLNINHTDVNNDGLLDIFVMRGAWYGTNGRMPNSLLLNKGNFKFDDVTETCGMLSFYPTQNSTWSDFNLDGWIDVFIGNESGSFACPNELYLNNGDGTFRNIIDPIKPNNYGVIKGCASGDLNSDGFPDLYISVKGGPNRLLINTGVDKSFETLFRDVSQEAMISAPLNSFPTWFFDFDQDGLQDIFVAVFNSDEKGNKTSQFVKNLEDATTTAYPRLYKNLGNSRFREISAEVGMRDVAFAMGSNFGDLDNDGYLDFYLGTGSPEFTAIMPNKMYRNSKGQTIQDVTTSGGFGHIQKGHGVAFGDIDKDGDSDIVMVVGGAIEGDISQNVVFENPLKTSNWINLKLEGTKSNKAAIGAKVEVVCKDAQGAKKSFYHVINTGGSFGANSLQLEVGLGKYNIISKVNVEWPTRENNVQSFENLKVGNFYRLVEGDKYPILAN